MRGWGHCHCLLQGLLFYSTRHVRENPFSSRTSWVSSSAWNDSHTGTISAFFCRKAFCSQAFYQQSNFPAGELLNGLLPTTKLSAKFSSSILDIRSAVNGEALWYIFSLDQNNCWFILEFISSNIVIHDFVFWEICACNICPFWTFWLGIGFRFFVSQDYLSWSNLYGIGEHDSYFFGWRKTSCLRLQSRIWM